jgi:acetyl-CoA synthetase
VLRVPSIGLTRGLWQDPDRYLESYWNTLPGLWVHGDWASRDADGMWYIHGRSDDTRSSRA